MISERIGDDTSDEALSLLEDITDTLTDFETKTQDSTNWKERYEQNDNEWRNKYKERFMSGVTPDADEEDDTAEDEAPKRYTFESLFKEG